LPVREGPPQPVPPPKGPQQLRDRVRPHQNWGIWTGIAAIAAVAFLAMLLVLPWADESKRSPTITVEKSAPERSSGPAGKP
jgi:hypothetical protein